MGQFPRGNLDAAGQVVHVHRRPSIIRLSFTESFTYYAITEEM
jgi:hypothetical protein